MNTRTRSMKTMKTEQSAGRMRGLSVTDFDQSGNGIAETEAHTHRQQWARIGGRQQLLCNGQSPTPNFGVCSKQKAIITVDAPAGARSTLRSMSLKQRTRPHRVEC